MMKEQIDIAVYNYREKINLMLNIQAKEIQKLGTTIGYNNKVILQQQDIIGKISNN